MTGEWPSCPWHLLIFILGTVIKWTITLDHYSYCQMKNKARLFHFITPTVTM